MTLDLNQVLTSRRNERRARNNDPFIRKNQDTAPAAARNAADAPVFVLPVFVLPVFVLPVFVLWSREERFGAKQNDPPG
jgi:hypothetical protein